MAFQANGQLLQVCSSEQLYLNRYQTVRFCFFSHCFLMDVALGKLSINIFPLTHLQRANSFPQTLYFILICFTPSCFSSTLDEPQCKAPSACKQDPGHLAGFGNQCSPWVSVCITDVLNAHVSFALFFSRS